MVKRIIKKSIKYHFGFTIVELLVVIVVIGVLAGISLVSYTGISAKAVDAAITTDLNNVLKKFKIHQVENSVYPTTIDCSTALSNTNICVKFSPNNQYTLTTDNSISNNQIFCISILNTTTNKRLYITNDGVTGTGVCPTFTLTVIAGVGGTATGSGTFIAGTNQTITSTLGTFATSSSWSGDVGCSGPASHTITMDANKTCTANFTLDSNWMAIGNQIWAKANLNVGTRLASTTNQTNNSVLEKYCSDNLESNCTIYGGLYQWDEAMQYVNTSGARGICPVGAHIPSDNDLKTLESQLGMSQDQLDVIGWRGTDQGAQLRAGGASGFNALLAGERYINGTFIEVSTRAVLWSSTESGTNAWVRELPSSIATLGRYNYNEKARGLSVRCLAN